MAKGRMRKETSPPALAASNKKQKKRKAGSSSPSATGERGEKLVVNKLVKKWKFSDADLARRFARNGIGKALLELDKDGFQYSESDPLLIISVDFLTDDESTGYFNQGNYGIAAAIDGHLARRIPDNEQQGPNAVGEFLNSFVGVQDKSGGDLTVLHFDSMGTMHAVRKEFSRQRQVCRVGPLMSTRLGVPREGSLVEFFTLDKIRSEPMPYEAFNMTP